MFHSGENVARHQHPNFHSHPVCGWRCPSCHLRRWGECLQQQGGEFPHTGSGELLHVLRGECLHVIGGHAATQSPPNPISRNTTTYIYVNIFKATFQVRQKYLFSILKDCKAATSTIQQYSILYTDTMSLNHPDIKVGKNCL